jgi:8-oxo-dGTP pyrophosphatase MutT (NUDIX family)
VRLPELGDLVSRLARALEAREPRRAFREGAKRAAVAVVMGGDAGPSIAFIRRKVRAGDPWSGQVAFPGGFQASEAESLETTARRETLEETGLDLARHGRLLGPLDDVSPRTPYLPPLLVAPFAYAVPSPQHLLPGDEADAALWIPAREIFDPGNRASFRLSLPTGTREFPAIQVRDLVIWGLTERILQQVADLAGLRSGE